MGRHPRSTSGSGRHCAFQLNSPEDMAHIKEIQSTGYRNSLDIDSESSLLDGLSRELYNPRATEPSKD